MSDLEATRSQTQHAAPITNLAHGKLRALRRGGLVIADSDSMMNAFAEVFARMAASAPAPVQGEGQQEHVANAIDDGESSQQDHQDSDESSDGAQAAQASDVKLESTVTAIDSDADAVVAGQQANKAAGPDVDVGEDLSDEPAESELQVESTVIVTTTQAETIEQDSLEPELAQPVFVSEDTDSRRNARRDANSGPAVEEAEIVQPSDERGTRTETQSPELEAPVVNVSADSDSGEDSSEGSRRRKPSERRAEPSPPVAESASKGQADKPEGNPVELASSGRGGENLADGSPPATPQATPEARRAAASAITGAPPVTASNPLPQSASQNNGASRQTAGNFNSAVDSLKPATTETKSKSNTPAKSPTSEAVDRAKLIQRVSKAFQHLGPDGGVVRLRLAPAEMGTVRVEMRINQRKINARVVAETEAASALLRENLPDLRSRLESFGMQVESIEVETDSDDTNLGGRFENDSRGEGWNDHQDRQSFQRTTNRDRRGVSRPVPPEADVAIDPVATGGTAGVDLRL